MKRLILSLALLLPAASPALARTEALFTSANFGTDRAVIGDRIVEVMNKAETRIHIAVAHFNSERLARALIKINERNRNEDPDDDIEIKVLVDMGEYGTSKSRARDLEAAGIEVRYKVFSVAFYHAHSQLMHHKFMLVDDTDLITGSYNWSDTAEFKNYENVIHYSKRNVKHVIAPFRGEFDKLWELDRQNYKPFMDALTAEPGDPAYRRYVPNHFKSDYYSAPMTLTRDELKDLRSAMWKIGFYDARGTSTRLYYDREERVGTNDAPEGTFLPSRWTEPAEDPPAEGAAGTRTDTITSEGAAGAVGETASDSDANADNGASESGSNDSSASEPGSDDSSASDSGRTDSGRGESDGGESGSSESGSGDSGTGGSGSEGSGDGSEDSDANQA